MWDILTEVLACPEMQFFEACLAMAAAIAGVYYFGKLLFAVVDLEAKANVRRALAWACLTLVLVCIAAFPAAMLWAFKAYATVCSY